MVTLVKINYSTGSFSFKSFYGRWQNKRAKDFIVLMSKKSLKCEII
jgi:hypothetical protein